LQAAEFTKTDAFTALLTVEGLLFTAFSVVFALGSTAPVARRLKMPAWVVGMVAAVALLGVSVAAFAGWLSLFASPWPRSATRGIEAVGLLIGLIAPPVFAMATAYGLRPEE